jgi:uncharacterized protein
MLWRGKRESGNIEDRRKFGVGGMGIGGLVIGAFVVYLMGGNPVAYVTDNVSSMSGAPVSTEQEDERKSFAAVVLGFTEDVWSQQFSAVGRTYAAPRMVLFRRAVDSACGSASSTTGPFYCPADQKIYLDLSFFDELSERLGAEGDTAAAYVIAHEVGHHVQNLLEVHRRARAREAEDPGMKNQLSVSVELQADCLAGVWARQIETQKRVIEPGDIEEAMGAASAVGDDRLQAQAQGYVVPDSFTHGSSAQRVGAFRQGYEGGSLASCPL